MYPRRTEWTHTCSGLAWITLLDLEVEIRPYPRGGPRFREEVCARGGKYPFPYLIDPNTDAALYESAAIRDHLYQTCGS